jgi:CBS domain-containing protein
MTVRDLMAKPTTTCRPKTDLAAASALMWENDCRVLPVLEETGRPVGILTDRDICIALGTRNTRAWELNRRRRGRSQPVDLRIHRRYSFRATDHA